MTERAEMDCYELLDVFCESLEDAIAQLVCGGVPLADDLLDISLLDHEGIVAR